MKTETLVHPIPPFFGGKPRILILGSFPSVKSRESGFYYGHPKNRFWALIARLCGEETPISVEEKKALLERHGIALWDVISSCTLSGSADSSIKNAVTSDIAPMIEKYGIAAVFTNGKKAHELYVKRILESTGVTDVCLPSTSPANASYGFDRLIKEWSVIKKYFFLSEISKNE